MKSILSHKSVFQTGQYFNFVCLTKNNKKKYSGLRPKEILWHDLFNNHSFCNFTLVPLYFYGTQDKYYGMFGFHRLFQLTFISSPIQFMKRKLNVISSFVTKIVYTSLYISPYHDKRLCYHLKISGLTKQTHILLP